MDLGNMYDKKKKKIMVVNILLIECDPSLELTLVRRITHANLYYYII